jgi:hypothetical protein
MQKSERTLRDFPVLPGQTTPGRFTETKCRLAVGPRPQNQNLPVPLNASSGPEVASTVCCLVVKRISRSSQCWAMLARFECKDLVRHKLEYNLKHGKA